MFEYLISNDKESSNLYTYMFYVPPRDNRSIISAWNHSANVHLATTSVSNEFKFWGITDL